MESRRKTKTNGNGKASRENADALPQGKLFIMFGVHFLSCSIVLKTFYYFSVFVDSLDTFMKITIVLASLFVILRFFVIFTIIHHFCMYGCMNMMQSKGKHETIILFLIPFPSKDD